MASFLYTSFATKLLNGGGIDLDSGTIKMALVDDTYVPNQDGHDFFNDISGEVVGTGYTAGGQALGSKTVTQVDASNWSIFDAADPSWPSSTLTARRGILYNDTGTPATSALIACVDFGSNQSTSLSTFTIPFNADGILRLAIT